MGTGSLQKNLFILAVAGWLALSTAGCSCAPVKTASSEGGSNGRSEQKTANQPAKSQQPKGESPHAPSPGTSGGGESSSKSQESTTETKGGDPASGSKSFDNRPKNGKTQSGLASLAEGLFGKPAVTRETMSPSEAHSRATSLEREAIELEKKGRKEEAFERVLEAWQLVRVHDQDAACCGLAQRLEPTLERLGEAANTSTVRATGKPLQVQ